MDRYIHEQNLLLYRARLAQTRDEDQRGVLLKLIAEELGRDSSLMASRKKPLPSGPSRNG